MRDALLAVLLLGLLAGTSPARALVDAEGETFELELGGSARLFPLITRMYDTPLENAHTIGLSVQRVRTELRVTGWDVVTLEAAYDFVPTIGSFSDMTGFNLTVSDANLLRIDDIDAEIDSGDSIVIRQNLDRLNLQIALPFATAVIGRQAISHGPSRILVPTDVFGPFSPASLDNEYKVGIDALRVSVPVGGTVELQGFAVGHADDMAQGLYLMSGRAILPALDVGLMAGSTYETATVAVDVEGDAGGTGWYAEALMRFPEGETGTIRTTAGIHYRFEYGLSTIFELHYSSLGADDPADYLTVATTTPEVLRGEMFLLGRFYGAANVSYEATPLITLNVLWIQSLIDGSALFGPSLSWDFDQNVAVGLGALIGVGERPDFTGVVPELKTELGTAPALYFGEVRFYY